MKNAIALVFSLFRSPICNLNCLKRAMRHSISMCHLNVEEKKNALRLSAAPDQISSTIFSFFYYSYRGEKTTTTNALSIE